MDIFSILAEERIRQALKDGEFADLPGKGKPLQLEDLSMIPEELRMSYKVLKNAGMIPEEMQLQKELLKIEDLLACCHDEAERKQLHEELTAKSLRFQQLIERRKLKETATFNIYRDKIFRKFL
ncbi:MULTISPECIES: DUF1992 domain-containing protein [unclassified Bacillus (in: firmicutes)]|uniref:DnaJ family domain-containing protein n=1 Tax=unclassified Bacillus (in: firmicutes) TaxID=185979 RepID=UPI0008E30A98|nr:MULTISPECIES: DUF1992 domain-containing protein [unclassified Bacillus (in: firmicutes)]SFJ61927.1 protein of unknown function [Bacillus sp. 71mf]SFT19924.1 protein of unknown function [Bacillus sp. 103mf]